MDELLCRACRNVFATALAPNCGGPIPSWARQVMASEHELWAITLKVERDHGDGAPRYIAQQIGAAAIAGEWDAVTMWKAIAARFDQLQEEPYSRA